MGVLFQCAYKGPGKPYQGSSVRGSRDPSVGESSFPPRETVVTPNLTVLCQFVVRSFLDSKGPAQNKQNVPKGKESSGRGPESQRSYSRWGPCHMAMAADAVSGVRQGQSGSPWAPHGDTASGACCQIAPPTWLHSGLDFLLTLPLDALIA